MFLKEFYASTVGKKVIVAVTGLFLIGFLLAHMVGNLQLFAGRGETIATTKLNEYAELLRAEMALLWMARFALLGALALHVSATIQLTLQNRAARPIGYARNEAVQATWASKMMIWGGLALFFFVSYHILHFTAGDVHSDLFTPGDVYGNVVLSFQNGWISAAYLLGQMALFFHLYHGVLSGFRTLGLSSDAYLALAHKLGIALALLITVGFSLTPIAVLAGWVTN